MSNLKRNTMIDRRASDGVALNRQHEILKEENNLYQKKRYPSEADLKLLIRTNNKLAQSFNDFGQIRKPNFRRIPKLLASADYGYESTVYLRAADIFQTFAHRDENKTGMLEYGPPLPTTATDAAEAVTSGEGNQQRPQSEAGDFDAERTKLQTYQLAFRALKYQQLFEQVLFESGHFRKHPVETDQAALLMVMFADFQYRNFASRPDVIGDVVPHNLREIETALKKNKIAIAAALARCRVKNQSLNIDFMLPEPLKNQESFAESLPLYFWVNTMKIKMSEVIAKLGEMGFQAYDDGKKLLPARGKFYRGDAHCGDLLLVPQDQRDILNTSELVMNSQVVVQDKTSCLAVVTMESLFTSDDQFEVIHTDVSSGLTTAHLAVTLYRLSRKRWEKRREMLKRLNFSAEPRALRQRRFWQVNGAEEEEPWTPPKVYAFGALTDRHRLKLESMFSEMNVTNVELIRKPFVEVSREEMRDEQGKFANVKSILITAQCTRSAVVNPVDFMLREGDSECCTRLKELSACTLHMRAAASARAHLQALKTAMKFKWPSSLVYVTRSKYAEENEKVVRGGMEQQEHRARHNHTTADGATWPGTYKLSPPTLSLNLDDVDDQQGDDATDDLPASMRGKFLKIRPNGEMNGCFVSVLVRSVDYSLKVKDVVRSQESLVSQKVSSTIPTQIERYEPSFAAQIELPVKKKSGTKLSRKKSSTATTKVLLVHTLTHTSTKSKHGKSKMMGPRRSALANPKLHSLTVDNTRY